MDLVTLMINEIFLLLYMVSAEEFRIGLNYKLLLLNISVVIMQVPDLLIYLVGNLDSFLNLPCKFPGSK